MITITFSKHYDFADVHYDEGTSEPEYKKDIYYFAVPKEWLPSEYPEAVSAEISIEIPWGDKGFGNCTVMMSPTREDDEEGEDYDWFEIYMSYSDIELMMGLAVDYSITPVETFIEMDSTTTVEDLIGVLQSFPQHFQVAIDNLFGDSFYIYPVDGEYLNISSEREEVVF